MCIHNDPTLKNQSISFEGLKLSKDHCDFVNTMEQKDQLMSF